MTYALVVVGAGSGQRLGEDVPKALVDLGGQPLILRTLSAFAEIDGLESRVLVLPEASIEWFRDGHRAALERAGVDVVVPGGARRQDSVLAGVLATPEASDLVLVHDAARPFVSTTIIEGVMETAFRHGAAVPALEPVDTLARLNGAGFIAAHEHRSRLRIVQTPQAARRDLLIAALENAGEQTFTDESAALLAGGVAVATAPGSAGNIKITTPEDLAAARRRVAPSLSSTP